MAERRPVCCERCKREYVTPFDLPPVVIHSIEEPAEGPTLSMYAAKYDNYSPETCRNVLARIVSDDHGRVMDLIRTTVSGVGLARVLLADGRPGLVTVVDNRPASTEYTIRVGIDLQASNAGEIARQKERCPFVVSETPVDLKALNSTLGLRRAHNERAGKLTWMLNNGGDYLTIGGLKLPGPAPGVGSFDVAFEQLCVNEKWEHVQLLWRVHFVIPAMDGPARLSD